MSRLGVQFPSLAPPKNRHFSKIGGSFYAYSLFAYVPYTAVVCRLGVAKSVAKLNGVYHLPGDLNRLIISMGVYLGGD